MPKETIPATKGSKRFVFVAAAISALGGMLFGYDTGVISGAILFIRQDFGLSDLTTGLVVSAVLMGAVIGAAFGGDLADRIGRRKTILIAATIFALGAIETSVVPSVVLLVLGRIVVGIAIGFASITAPLYISEVSPAKVRGSLVSLNQLFITVGIVISYLVDYLLSDIQGWRYMLLFAAVPAIILGIGMLPLPDTPRWLVTHNKIDKARSTLQRISNTTDVDDNINEIKKSLNKQATGRGELFKPLVKPALIIGISLAVFQQFTGINTVIYYAPTIFQFAGFASASSAILATFGVGIVNVVMTIVAILLLDKVGRRPLLLTGLIGMIFSLILLGVVFFLPNLTTSLGELSTVALMIYVGSFAIGLGPVFWLLISEIYPLKVRGLAMGIASEANWGSNLLVALTFLTLINFIGRSGTFWLYALISIGAWIFVFFLVPETKGRTLEYIEEHWRKGKHPRVMGKE